MTPTTLSAEIDASFKPLPRARRLILRGQEFFWPSHPTHLYAAARELGVKVRTKRLKRGGWLIIPGEQKVNIW